MPSANDPTPLHELNPTGRFSDRAGDYVSHRPTYPAAAIDRVLEGLPGVVRGADGALTARGLVAADVGAGTGISARLLARRGAVVYAVEPNAEMRRAGASDAGGVGPGEVRWRDATAEATGLGDASVDLVLCAQAFHWFRAEEALTEFLRVLRPGGRAAIVWNIRDRSDAFTDRYSALMLAAATGPVREENIDDAPLMHDPRFVGASASSFRNEQALTVEGLLGRARSASYCPKTGPAWETLSGELALLHAGFASGEGVVRLRYVTRVFMADAPGM